MEQTIRDRRNPGPGGVIDDTMDATALESQVHEVLAGKKRLNEVSPVVRNVLIKMQSKKRS
jgi:hypothetical protein